MVPVPGWTGEYEWEEWIPFEELPTVFNPERGYIVTANHAVVDEDYPHLITNYWSPGDRGQRIVNMLDEIISTRKITASDMATMHMDSYAMLAKSYVPLLAGLSSDDASVQAALTQLQEWEDYQLRRDSVPSALFELFYMHLVANVIADDVGEDNTGSLHSLVFFHALAEQPDAPWWDNQSTPAIESREDILLQSVAETVEWFESNIGPNIDEWTWGHIHTVTFVSLPLGQSGIGPIESLVNIGPYAVDGSGNIVNATAWRWSDPARVVHHPSMRMIVDMSDLDASLSILPTGQSGHPTHKHYDDMTPLWANGEYNPMLWSREAVEANAVDHLVLQPE